MATALPRAVPCANGRLTQLLGMYRLNSGQILVRFLDVYGLGDDFTRAVSLSNNISSATESTYVTLFH